MQRDNNFMSNFGENSNFSELEQKNENQKKSIGAHVNVNLKKTIQNYQYHLPNIIRLNKLSTIYMGYQTQSHQACAIKVTNLTKVPTQQSINYLQNQNKLCKVLSKHKNIVNVFDVVMTNNNSYIMMEICKTDLKRYLKHKRCLDQQEFLNILADILAAIKYLYDNQLMHCNIKPSNVLLTKQGAKITDFSKCRPYKLSNNSKQQFQPSQWSPYMSPLTLVSKMFSQNNQVWSLGVLIYECLHGYQIYPWKFQKFYDLTQQIYKGAIIKYNKSLSKQIVQLINKCLHESQKMQISDLFKDPFILRLLQTKKQSKPIQIKQIQNNQTQKLIHAKSLNRNIPPSGIQIQYRKLSQQRKEKKYKTHERNQKISIKSILQSQIAFMRFNNIIIKHNQKNFRLNKNDPKYIQLKFDYQFFRFVLLKQTLSMKESIKQTLDAGNLKNPFNIQQLDNYLQNQENQNQINILKTFVDQYDKKYQPLQKEMILLIQSINKQLLTIKPQWRSRQILNLNFQRTQILSILGIRLSRDLCKNVWRQIQALLNLIADPKVSNVKQIFYEIQLKGLYLDFLMSYYILNCLLIQNFEDCVNFTIKSNLKIIVSSAPIQLKVQSMGLIQKKLRQLQIIPSA